jgi:glycosyltransferase involved in cell wall biosynthesis
MKIVQLLPELNEGGVERGTVDLSRELVLQGHESVVISSGGKLADQVVGDGGMHILFDVCSKNPFTVISRMLKLRRLLKELNPDIIHARSRVPAWLAYLANKSLRIPLVTTVHGFNSVSPYSRIMTMGDHVICVSTSIKEYIQSHYKTPDFKITVIPRGIDLQKFNPENVDHDFMESFSHQYGLEGKFVVTVVGRITQLKDIETLIKAVAIVKKTETKVVALIVGGVRDDKQSYFESLKSLVRELHLEDTVIFTGSQSKVAEIYALSDVVVSASKKPESFGRSVAEAIAMNTPVIATNHGGVLDIIQEGIHGFFINTGDASLLASKIIESKTLQFDGRSYIEENFSLKQMVNKSVRAYKQLISQGQAG